MSRVRPGPKTTALATNAYLPYFRRDAATLLTPKPLLIPKGANPFGTPDRAVLGVTLHLGGPHEVTTEVGLYGPGEVIGFDANAVTRVWPRRGVLEAETDSFAHIEFDQPDLPWRYTIDSPSFVSGPVFGDNWPPPKLVPVDRLKPWIVLIVLKPDEIGAYRPPDATRPLASVKVRDLAALPNLAQSWAWAHTQVTGKRSITPEEAIDLFRTAPQTMLSRILCLRRLRPRIAYRAFLVPAFERGRRAGLGLPTFDRTGLSHPIQEIEVDAMQPSWTTEDRGGDRTVELPVYYEWEFQTAAAASDFASLAKRLVARPLPADVGTRAIDGSKVDAALPAASPHPLVFTGALKPRGTFAAPTAAFLAAMRTLVNTPATAPVRPPMYGRWLAARATADAALPWLESVNVDPRLRAAAGAGARVVHEHEEKLLVASWQQIEGVTDINERLRTAQLARALSTRAIDRRLRGATLDSFLMLTAPFFARIRTGGKTIASLIAASRIGRGPFEPVFRRLLRRVAGDVPILARIQAGQLAANPLPPGPMMLATPAPVTFAGIRDTPLRPSFVLVKEVGPGAPPPVPTFPGTGTDDSFDAVEFRIGARKMLALLRLPFPTQPQPPALALDSLRSAIANAIEPAKSLTQRLQRSIRIDPGFPRAAADPLEPILAAPSFDDPLYELLAEISQEWILPGVGNLPSNTITTALSNQEFIEAAMLGLTHELNRTLLWRSYPTDQRATYLRSFWDSRSYFGPLPDESLRDIKPIETWPAATKLGTHSSRPPLPAGTEPLVLILRGDLLLQYPTAIVYATRAMLTDGRFEPLQPAQEKHPIFRGRLEPDLSFFGFDLTADDARATAGGGWFFVLQEQPNEPRFGFDAGTTASAPVAQWSDLTWAHFPVDVDHLDLSRPALTPTSHPQTQPSVVWLESRGTTSAHIAWIARREPVRVAFHGSRVIPQD